MKYSALTVALLAGANAFQLETPVVETANENTMWYVEGAKGWHAGFYKALYKTGHVITDDSCLDTKTIDNLSVYTDLLEDPFSIFSSIANVEKDFNLFADGAEIMENLSACKFEAPAFDLMHMCNANPANCDMKHLMDNLTKNMFVLVGKFTSLAETL